jgi:hypothetical protein
MVYSTAISENSLHNAKTKSRRGVDGALETTNAMTALIIAAIVA